jgi:Ca2+-binding EF-hand superfamily protein
MPAVEDYNINEESDNVGFDKFLCIVSNVNHSVSPNTEIIKAMRVFNWDGDGRITAEEVARQADNARGN